MTPVVYEVEFWVALAYLQDDLNFYWVGFCGHTARRFLSPKQENEFMDLYDTLSLLEQT